MPTSSPPADLLPYQLDGVAFAAAAGRAILADDMGLGKTIQAIGIHGARSLTSYATPRAAGLQPTT